MLEKGELVEHSKDIEYQKRRNVVGLIDIYEGKFNNIGAKMGKSNPLSKSWYVDKKKKNVSIFNQLKSNTENYFRTVAKTDSDFNMYTVFNLYQKYIKGKGYARGTNKHRDKKALAYLFNQLFYYS